MTHAKHTGGGRGKEEAYLDKNIGLIEAAVRGSLMGLLMFGVKKDESMGETVMRVSDTIMELVRKDVRRIYKQGKRVGRTAPNPTPTR